jgi:hypothetical protein
MKQAGKSNRAIAKETGHDRCVISKIWSDYCISYSKNRHSNTIEIGHPIFKFRLNARFVMGVADFSIILGGCKCRSDFTPEPQKFDTWGCGQNSGQT